MKKLLSILSVLFITLSVSAQSREYIRNQISKHGECRNVAITKYNGDLMLYGQNGWASTGCPNDLTEALHELNEKREYITDVQLTDEGSWLIIYGDNGCRWNDIPYSLENKLTQWNNSGEEITSVSFNDDGDWIAICKRYVSSSDTDLQKWVVDGMEKYGAVWATCITDDAAVVVYEKGYRFLGNVPSDLKKKLDVVPFDVYRIKIAGTAWFISDGVREYDYNM
jgi:hypothetical protein